MGCTGSKATAIAPDSPSGEPEFVIKSLRLRLSPNGTVATPPQDKGLPPLRCTTPSTVCSSGSHSSAGDETPSPAPIPRALEELQHTLSQQQMVRMTDSPGLLTDGVEGLETLMSGDEDETSSDDSDDDDDGESEASAPTPTPEPEVAVPVAAGVVAEPAVSARAAPHSTGINVTQVVNAKKLARRGRRGTVESTELVVTKDDSGNKTVNQ